MHLLTRSLCLSLWVGNRNKGNETIFETFGFTKDPKQEQAENTTAAIHWFRELYSPGKDQKPIALGFPWPTTEPLAESDRKFLSEKRYYGRMKNGWPVSLQAIMQGVNASLDSMKRESKGHFKTWIQPMKNEHEVLTDLQSFFGPDPRFGYQLAQMDCHHKAKHPGNESLQLLWSQVLTQYRDSYNDSSHVKSVLVLPCMQTFVYGIAHKFAVLDRISVVCWQKKWLPPTVTEPEIKHMSAIEAQTQDQLEVISRESKNQALTEEELLEELRFLKQSYLDMKERIKSSYKTLIGKVNKKLDAFEKDRQEPEGDVVMEQK